jgi:RNA polymerase sigma factor (sigma-70 family)
VEPRGGGLDDADLLRRFANDRDEAAFEVLLWRYGPLVLAVCRRMLRREQDVEDAFQATFLTLVRKAKSIARHEALGGWLHQVAYRIGLRARVKAARDGISDQGRVETAIARSERETASDWRELLDHEVHRLPRRYRVAFILCYLKGKTYAEAGRLLACPPGTIASRLAWARDRLRARLTARGLTLPATLACLIVPAETEAASLARLIPTAQRTARMITSGTLAGSEPIPAHVTAWSKGAVRAMFLSKVQVVVSLILVSVLVGAGGSVVWQRVQAGGGEAGPSDEPPIQASAQPQLKPKVFRPPVDPKPAERNEIEELQVELARADIEYQDLEERWDRRMADIRREAWAQERAQRTKKARLAYEAKRTSRALEMAEARYEKLTNTLDGPIPGPVSLETLQKKQQEAQKQAEQLGAKLLECELALAELDEPSPVKLQIESLERQRALEVGHVRRRIEAIERKLHPVADDAGAARMQEVERKVEAVARAVEELRKALAQSPKR